MKETEETRKMRVRQFGWGDRLQKSNEDQHKVRGNRKEA